MGAEHTISDHTCSCDAAIIYPYVPHYRIPVFRALLKNGGHRKYAIFAGLNTIDASIKSVLPDEQALFTPTPVFTVYKLTFQFGLLRVCLSSKYRHLIFLGDPHFATTWLYAMLGRITGKKVWFWTHGWLRSEAGPRKLTRNLFYRLANGLLLYGDRAKDLGLLNGFDPESLHVIYNSLDYDEQRRVRAMIEAPQGDSESANNLPGELTRTLYIACIARLTKLCRFDLAIEAVACIRQTEGFRITLVFIGDGPEEQALAEAAKRLDVDCIFMGAVYDESIIGPVLYNARVTVSPGKVGLTAMHSLAYGTPVISHNDFDRQMPEHEAIVPGVTGDFFRAGDSRDLAKVLLSWLKKDRDDMERRSCSRLIEARYTPERQLQLIESVLDAND